MRVLRFAFLALGGCATAPQSTEFAQGVCAYPAFVGMSGQTGQRPGPDFTVTDIATEKGPISIYQGCCASVSGDKKALFLTIDGQPVYRTSNETGFTGYLTTRVRRYEGSRVESQAHFFGAGLYGDDRDRKFFQRVRLGDYAAKRCVGERATGGNI